MKQAQFLERLQQEADLQAKLHTQRVLPSQLDWFTSLVGRYPWQVLIVVSGLVAMVYEFGGLLK